MTGTDSRPPVWVIWGLVALFGALEAIAWSAAGSAPRRPGELTQVIATSAVVLVLASVASRRLGTLERRIRAQEHAQRTSLGEIEQLQTQNAILEIIARSVDVTLAFQALAGRIARIVPCDRVGLALLSEDGREFETYTARVHDDERRPRTRPDVVFKFEQTVLGKVVQSRQALVIPDVSAAASDSLDANILHTAGFGSALIVPLLSKGRAVGTLNLVQRAKHAYGPEHVRTLQPIAEIFAVAVVAQQLQLSLGKYRTMEAMTELTLSTAADINSALQTIVGHCNLLERGYPEPNLQHDLATVVSQAHRIEGLLGKMRDAANQRMKELEAEMSQAAIASDVDPAAADPQV